MRRRRVPTLRPLRVRSIESLEARVVLAGFTAYNDVATGPTSNPNTTHYSNQGVASSGFLCDINTGEFSTIQMEAWASGWNPIGPPESGAEPPLGSDAYDIFHGFVDFSTHFTSGIAGQSYLFSGLDPDETYEFTATLSFDGPVDPDAWYRVLLREADSAVANHSDSPAVTALPPDPNDDDVTLASAIIWAGGNQTVGAVVRWSGIDPGEDGSFWVASLWWNGAIPTSITQSAQPEPHAGPGRPITCLLELHVLLSRLHDPTRMVLVCAYSERPFDC